VTGNLSIKEYVTNEYESLADVNKSIDALHSGDCLRAVIKISGMKSPEPI